MKKFLQAVAAYYLNNSAPDLSHTWLIVPNKRSGMYLRYYLKKQANGTFMMPAILTMGSFMARVGGAGSTEATRLEQLFALYRAYINVRASHGLDTRPFEQFAFWGEMMLDDFNDIDANMADVDKVLQNVSDLREIESNYLTEEQIEVAREVWGIEMRTAENFWKHVPHDGSQTFLNLWELLLPTYRLFHEYLNESGMMTRGYMARRTAELTSKTDFTLEAESIGFIGFEVLNGAERVIFRNLLRSGLAKFFWDEPLSLTRDLPKGSKDFIPLKNYIRRLKKDYPMPVDFAEPAMVGAPDITIFAVPSNSYQAKITCRVLESWIDKGMMSKNIPDSTAVVLPAPGILTTLLHSLPSEEKVALNITMGLPMRHTPFATLMSAITTMHIRASFSHGETHFLTEDVDKVINHPSMITLAPDDTMTVRQYIVDNRRITVPAGELRNIAKSLSFLFSDAAMIERTGKGVRELFEGLIAGMTELAERIATNDNLSKKYHEFTLLKAYREAVNAITATVARYSVFPELSDIQFDRRTFIILLERLLYRSSLNMSGAPMRGLQIMGPLETRSLDFDNIIMLSTNERVFPKRTYFKSLIPHSIRVGYGLNTVEHSELQYSWIFYNLISRSKRTVFLYDARQEGVGSSEMSRYLYQIQHVFTNLKPHFNTIQPEALPAQIREIKVEKTEGVIHELKRFHKGGDLRMSASALKDYLKCPLKFYIRYVKGMRDDVKPTEYIDSATIGTIVHRTFEDFFKPYIGKQIHPEQLRGGIARMSILSGIATKFNELYYRNKYADNLDNMPGEALMLVKVLGDRIIEVLNTEVEKRTEPFTYVGSEVHPTTDDRTVDWQVTPELCIRFTYSIDRIDRLSDGTLRFIDYKTGRDALTTESLTTLFGTEKTEVADAILQLLLYANIYADTNSHTGNIRPEVIKVFDARNSIEKRLGFNGGKKKSKDNECITIETYTDAVGFREMLEQRLTELFDDTTPFTQAINSTNCKYCQFKDMCNRE